MRLLILLLLIAVPLAELAILIELGGVIGALPTVGLVVLTAVVGLAIIRRQGAAAYRRARAALDAEELPVEPVVDGACLLVAGALLLAPGLMSDTVGFLLLVPPLRRWLAGRVLAKLDASVHIGPGPFGRRPGGGGARPPGTPAGPTIDGEFTPVDETPPRELERGRGPRAPSPWNR